MDIKSKTFLVWFVIGGAFGGIGTQVAIRNINVPDSYHEDITAMYNKFPERLSPMMKKYKETNEMTYHEYWKLEKEFRSLTKTHGKTK